ncbi:hypothetical protein, partial [Vibrio campbellii]|uniref:hypothetical protein n=1 Tax=Vibrio campbellii TaxID=680 RepID=UPI001E564123
MNGHTHNTNDSVFGNAKFVSFIDGEWNEQNQAKKGEFKPINIDNLIHKLSPETNVLILTKCGWFM